MADQVEFEDEQFNEDGLTKPAKPSGVENIEPKRGSKSCVWRPGGVYNGMWIPGYWDCGD